MILVTGADGLLGSWLRFRYQKDTFGLNRKELDITNRDDIRDALHKYRPEVVVNCAGLTNKVNASLSVMREVNTIGPILLAAECSEVGAKLIHISTDCVFNGKRGAYTEEDIPNALTLYGMSKWAADITVCLDHLVIRSSFVGWPDPKRRSLLSWLHDHRGEVVPGYTCATWNGLTTCALADYIIHYAYSRVPGLLHIYGQTISKYTLLEIVNGVYGWKARIVPQQEPVSDMTLRSKRKQEYIPGTYNFMEQALEMKKWEKNYLRWLNQE